MAIKPEALCRFHPKCANVVPRVQVCLGSKAVNTCCLALPITNPGEKNLPWIKDGSGMKFRDQLAIENVRKHVSSTWNFTGEF